MEDRFGVAALYPCWYLLIRYTLRILIRYFSMEVSFLFISQGAPCWFARVPCIRSLIRRKAPWPASAGDWDGDQWTRRFKGGSVSSDTDAVFSLVTHCSWAASVLNWFLWPPVIWRASGPRAENFHLLTIKTSSESSISMIDWLCSRLPQPSLSSSGEAVAAPSEFDGFCPPLSCSSTTKLKLSLMIVLPLDVKPAKGSILDQESSTTLYV